MTTVQNSTFYDTVVREAQEAGILPPSSTDEFDDDSLLSAPLLKLKMFTDKCQRMLIRTLNKKFTERLYKFNTVVGQAVYDLDPETNVESIKYHSVRCNTTGSCQPLHNLDHNLYRETWTDESLIPLGAPQQWVCEIGAGGNGVLRINQIRIVPTPVAIVEIEYAAKISMQPLVMATDIIMFPPEYEDVLWTWAEAMLEKKLGVDATMQDYAQMAIDSCRMWGERPIDEKRGVKMGVKIKNGGNLSGGSYYDNQNFTAGWGT